MVSEKPMKKQSARGKGTFRGKGSQGGSGRSTTPKGASNSSTQHAPTGGDARGRGSFSRRGRGSEKCHRDEMTAEVREREIAVIKVQLQVLEEWLQEQEDQNRKWIFPLKGKRVIWRQLQRRLRQIVIALLKRGLRVLEPEMEFEDSTRRYVQRKMLEEAAKNKKSCSFKTNELCVFAGAEEVSIGETEEKIIMIS